MIPSSPNKWRRDLLALTLVFGALFFVELGTSALINPDEGRYAEVPREMVAAGDWVTPRLDGVVYFEKPPLMYWIEAAGLRLLGPSEWTMRAPPALFALSGVLLVYAAGRRLHGRTAGIASAVVLGTSMLYFALGRVLILDMAVSVLMSATLLCFILGVREPPGPRRRWLFYGLYASAALATLTKGLIGVLVTGGVMFSWLLVFNQWRRLLPMYLPSGLLLFLAIAAPWHVLAAAHNPQWAHFYFIHEHWERFTTTEHGRAGAWWYFIPIVLLGLFPWTGFLWCSLSERFRGGWATRKQNPDDWFLAIWAGLIFLFFSYSQSKLIPYILPVFPPLALLIGPFLARAVADGAPSRLRNGLRAFAFMAGLVGAAMLLAAFRPGIISNEAQRLELRDNAVWGAVALFTGGILAMAMGKVRGARPALLAVALAVGALYVSLGRAQDEIARPGTRELALIVKAQAGPADRVYHYHEFFQDFTYYAARTVGTVAYDSELELDIDPAARTSGRFIDEPTFRSQWNEPGRVWAVARKEDVAALFADPAFHYNLLGETRNHYLFSNQP